MNKIAGLALLLFASSLYAYSWQGQGFSVKEKSESGSTVKTDLKKNDVSIEVTHPKNVKDARLDKVKEIHERITSIKGLKISEVRYVVDSRNIEIIIKPESYSYNKTDFMQYLPGNMLFIYKDSLEYNFRILVNKIFVRIKGLYRGEKELNEKMLEAVENPEAYLRKRDPEFFLTKLSELEENMKNLRSDLDKTREAHNRTRYALITLHNDGFFSGPEEVSQQKIDKVLSMKENNKSLSAEQIEEALNKQGFEISDQEVELIIAAFYNEFAD